MKSLSWEEFTAVEIRVGTIIDIADFPKAKKPAYQLTIDFGNAIGLRKSSAQITDKYSKKDLLGRQIVAVVNFPPKQIANFISECLVLGAVDVNHQVTLLQPESSVINGLRIL